MFANSLPKRWFGQLLLLPPALVFSRSGKPVTQVLPGPRPKRRHHLTT